jgi:hypothetical protein
MKLTVTKAELKTRTGPHLIQDLLDYDPRPLSPESGNLAMNTPRKYNFAVHQSNTPRIRHASSCHHRLILKPEQSNILPDYFFAASPATVASCCETCLSHFTVVLDSAEQTPRGNRRLYRVPTGHFFRCSARQSNKTRQPEGVGKDERWTEKHYFECSAPHCSTVLLIYISPPRLNAEDVKFLTNESNIGARGQAVIQSGRYIGSGHRSSGEALRYLVTYLGNILGGKARRIPREDNNFRLAFGREPLDIFRRLGFIIEVRVQSPCLFYLLQLAICYVADGNQVVCRSRT